MKTLKKVLLGAMFLCLTQVTYAQSMLTPEQEQQVADNIAQFLTDINLSEQDKPAFGLIIQDHFTGVVALAVTSYSPRTKYKIFKTLVKERDRRMKNLLSKEQYKVYKARLKERKETMAAMME